MAQPVPLFLAATAALGLSGPAVAQQVRFDSTPVANSCNAPNVITMTPAPAVWIAPQASRVLTKVVNNFQTPLGNFVAVGDHVIQPGQFCFFHSCGAANILLTCAPVGSDSDATVNITLKRVPGSKKSPGSSKK